MAKIVQKGFWPGVDGVTEHLQLLTHMIKDAKRHQRSLVVTLLDLRSAFGEVHHNLIWSALEYHHIPIDIFQLISNIYVNNVIQVSHASSTSIANTINI